MAVDPATQFQQATIQASGYTPIVGGNLGGSHLFGGAGALWAKVGETALQAADQIQKSPLNPQVREQMKEAVQRARLGQKFMQYVATHPSYLHGTVAESPQGASVVAPITQPVAQQAAQNIDVTDGGDGGTKEVQQQPTITRTGKNTGVDQDGQPWHETTPGSNQWTKGAPPPLPAANLNVGMARGGLVRGYDRGGTVSSGTKSDEELTKSDEELQREAARVAPPGTFMNPATGNYEPLQQGQQGSSIWSPQRPAPAAPPAPSGRQAAPSGYFFNPASGSYEQLQQQPQQQQPQAQQPSPVGDMLMSQWQNQNAHPVAPVSEALKWAKNNFDTRVTDATYLPHGGPLNQPAYAFHMKGGGTNMVPLSQMVQNGFAANIAGNNTSMTLSAADQQQRLANQQMQPTGAVGGQAPALQQGQGTQPPPQMQPTGNVGQPPPAAPGAAPGAIAGGVAGAPPAPGGQELRDIYGNPISSYTALASKGGPPVSQLTASTEGAGQLTRPSAENASVEQLNADANSSQPYFNWKTDPNAAPEFRNKRYLALPEDADHPFLERRFYQGSTGYVGRQGNDQQWNKQQIYDALGSGKSDIPLPRDANGNPIVLTKGMIDNLTPDEQNKYLAYIHDYNLHQKTVTSTEPEGMNLTNAAKSIQDLQRIKDKLLYMKENNIPMSAISQDEILRSKAAGWAAANPKDSLQNRFWNRVAGGRGKSNFTDELSSDYQNANNHLANVKGGTYEGFAATPQQREIGLNLRPQIPFDFGYPLSTDVSTIPQLVKIGSGDNYDEALGHVQEILDNATGDYRSIVAKLPKAGLRVPDEHQKNIADLDDSKKGYIDDSTNRIWDKKHEKMVNAYGDPPESATQAQEELRRMAQQVMQMRETLPGGQPPVPIGNEADLAAFKKLYPDPNKRPRVQLSDGRIGQITD